MIHPSNSLPIEEEDHSTQRNQNESTVIQLEKALKRYLLIDTNSLVHHNELTGRAGARWRKYKYFVVIFHFSYIIRFAILLSNDSKHLHNALGEYFRFFGTGNVNVYLVAGIVSLTLPCFFTTLNGFLLKRYAGLESAMQYSLRILHVISGKREPESIGLERSDLKRLRFIARISAFASNYGYTVSCTMFFFLIPYLFLVNVDYEKYWWQLIISKFQFDAFLILVVAALSTGLSYFYIICLVIRIRIERLTARLISYDHAITGEELIDLLSMHDDISVSIDRYNAYWRLYLLFSYILYIPYISLVSYIAFVAYMSLYLKVLFALVFIEFTSILSFTCISAGKIHSTVS